MTPRLLLFDIDGTMVRVRRGLSRTVFLDAFGTVLEIEEISLPSGYTFHGRTDRSIYFDLAAHHEVNRMRAESLVGDFIDALIRGWNVSLDRNSVDLLPGVTHLLDALESEGRHSLGLLTGNVRAGAIAKLAPHDLYDRFIDGAFGSDATARNDLPPIALERIAAKSGTTFEPRDAVIIGDSVRDIECAQAHGLRVVAVATGGSTRQELEGHDPDLLLDTLEEPAAFFQFLDSVTRP